MTGINIPHRSPVDFKGINTAALPRLHELLREWLPNGRRQGREYVARNPRRTDNRPGSFSVNLVTGKWGDFATGDMGGDVTSLFAYLEGLGQMEAAQQVAERIGAAPTVAEVASVAGGNGNSTGQTHEVWTPIIPVPADAPKLTRGDIIRVTPAGYADADCHAYRAAYGAVVGVVVRLHGPIGDDGKPAKTFRPFTFCLNADGRKQWRCQGLPEPRPLYGLHLLAKRPEAAVLIVEGEATAHAAHDLFTDHCAATSMNGAQSVHKTDWSPLAGRDVTVWPDADAPGAKYATDVIEELKRIGAKSIKVVSLPPGLPEGWDLADTLPEGLTVADLKRLLAEARPATDANPGADDGFGAEVPSEGPLPLFPELPPAEPYPIEALGPILSRSARAIVRKIQAPDAIAAQSVLAAAAIAAQAHADVVLPYGQKRPLSLFFVTVAKSGDRKSSADNEASWPIARREKAMREEHVEDMKVWRVEHGAWSAQRKKIESDGKIDLETRKEKLAELGEEPPRPLSPFLTSGDLTIEGLTKNWPFAHAALGIFSAEAGQFTGGHAMADDARLRTAAMLSEIWDGKPVKRIRALDGVSILPGRRLSMHLLVQPEAAAGFLANPVLRDQGLLSRVLVAAPDSLAGTRLYREVDPKDDAAIHAYGARILSLLEAPLPLVEDTKNELAPREIRLSVEAEKAWRQFYDNVEGQCGGDLKPIVDFAAKAAEHAARIAGVLTIVEDIQAKEISLQAMANALALADWYVVEALRLHAGCRMDPRLLKAASLLEWMQSEREPELEFRKILQFGPGAIRTKQAAEEALDILAKHGWITQTSGRPRRFKVARSEA